MYVTKKHKYMKYYHFFLLIKNYCGYSITLIFVVKYIFVGLNFIIIIFWFFKEVKDYI